MVLNETRELKIRFKRIYPKFNPFQANPYFLPIVMLIKLIERRREKKGWIDIKGANIYILDKEETIIQEFNINELKDFRVYFVDNPLIESAESEDKAELKKRFSRITFNHDKIKHEIFYWSKKKDLLKIFNQWYEGGVRFKEYYNRRRVYLGRQPSYSDIQVLKKLHNFEW